MKYMLAFLLVFTLTACSAPTPDPSVIAAEVAKAQALIPTATAYPTLTAYPTYTPYPTLTPANTTTPIIQIVTPTYTPTPIFTATITLTPTRTPTSTKTPIPTPTIDLLKLPKRDGFYLINVDIAPGVWRSGGTTDNCYWAVTAKTGKIISNHFGMAGGTAYIPPTGYQVEFNGCGLWSFLSD